MLKKKKGERKEEKRKKEKKERKKQREKKGKKYNATRFAALLPRNLRNTKMLVNCISNEFLFCGEYIKLQFVVQLWQAFKPQSIAMHRQHHRKEHNPR